MLCTAMRLSRSHFLMTFHPLLTLSYCLGSLALKKYLCISYPRASDLTILRSISVCLDTFRESSNEEKVWLLNKISSEQLRQIYKN